MEHTDSQTAVLNEANIACMICGESGSAEAMLCQTCFAPMALVHDSRAQQRTPRIVSVIGESNVGKTVYLGFLLDMLTQRAGDFEAVPRGAYSVDLQQTVISHMAHRRFPPKTPMEADQWLWAYYQVIHRGSNRFIDLIMPDMAGESIAAEIATPRTIHVISNLVRKSAGLLLLVDAAMAAHGSTQPDFFALKLLSYIDQLAHVQRDALIPNPVAVVLCKADHTPDCFNDPRRFAQANLNRLWNLCETRFARFEFFACSVVGSLAYAAPAGEDEHVTPVPLHTALRGVLEPFEWIIEQI